MALGKLVAEKTTDLVQKNRDMEIETVLERVPTRTMAMHKSEELGDLSFELVKQVQALGVTSWYCAFNIYDTEQKRSTEWGREIFLLKSSFTIFLISPAERC